MAVSTRFDRSYALGKRYVGEKRKALVGMENISTEKLDLFN